MLSSVSSADIHLLRVFMAVAESGSFSGAQIHLNVSQSTISTQMAELETRLDLRLCRRGRAGFSLTDDGHAVYEAAKQLLQNCDDFVTTVRARRGTLSGDLRLALADALVGNPDFPADKIFRSLRERMPNVNIVLSSADPLTIERQILDQRIHAGIHTFPNHAPGLRYTKLFNERQTLYCSDTHPLFSRKDESIDIGELENCDYVARDYYGGRLRTGNLNPMKITARCITMEGTLALILSGKFIGHLPSLSSSRWEEAGRLRPLLPDRLSYDGTFECAFSVGTPARPLDIMEKVLLSELTN